jgi:hypothetical protein
MRRLLPLLLLTTGCLTQYSKSELLGPSYPAHTARVTGVEPGAETVTVETVTSTGRASEVAVPVGFTLTASAHTRVVPGQVPTGWESHFLPISYAVVHGFWIEVRDAGRVEWHPVPPPWEESCALDHALFGAVVPFTVLADGLVALPAFAGIGIYVLLFE